MILCLPGIKENGLNITVSVLVQDKLVIGLDHGYTITVHSQDEGVAIGPVAAVGNIEHCGAVEWELHHTCQVPNLGHDVCLSCAILTMSLGKDRHLKKRSTIVHKV